MSKITLTGGIKTCATCGKTFVATQDYIYRKRIKNKKLFYCSYSCMHKDEKETKYVNRPVQRRSARTD